MFVCEKCHSADKDAIECHYTHSAHEKESEIIMRGMCDICGQLNSIIFCCKYPSMDAATTRKTDACSMRRCDYCEFFGKCDIFVKEGRDPECAKECMTFVPEKENTDGRFHDSYFLERGDSEYTS